MGTDWEHVLPNDIEARSFAIIEEELGDTILDSENAAIIKRVIHTTADFSYAKQLVFSPSAVKSARAAIRQGATIVTDTQMAMAGINKKALSGFGGKVCCFIADDDVAKTAELNQTTRSVACMDKAATITEPLIIVIGNAPTALRRVYELIQCGKLSPLLVIGVPVGFVNVIQSKELILGLDTPHIVALGRKGGSTVAAAIINALLYGMS